MRVGDDIASSPGCKDGEEGGDDDDARAAWARMYTTCGFGGDARKSGRERTLMDWGGLVLKSLLLPPRVTQIDHFRDIQGGGGSDAE